MQPLDESVKAELDSHLNEIGKRLKSNVMSIIRPILPGIDTRVRTALDLIAPRKVSIAIILDTPGGVVEVVERMVTAIRHYYKEVIYLVPGTAMSAGTILALSGDKILMDFFSCLGPIDPQVEKDGYLVPALSYLNQYERLNEKATKGELTSAEYALLSKLDLGELYQFEQARELSRELLIKWLSNYMFRTWLTPSKTPAPQKMKVDKATIVANVLGDVEKWHSHGRGINMHTLINELGLEIEDFSKTKDLGPYIHAYFNLLRDYLQRQKWNHFVHIKGYF